MPPPTPRRAGGSNVQNFAAGKKIMSTINSRKLLKNELASRITYDDDNILESVFKISRIPDTYVNGCLAVLRTKAMRSAIRTVTNLANVNDKSVEAGMYEPLIEIINAIASYNPKATTKVHPSHWTCANRRAVRTENNTLRDDSAGYPIVPDRSPDFVMLEEGTDFSGRLWRQCDALGEVKAHASFYPATAEPEQPSGTTLQIADASRVHLTSKPFQLFSTTLCVSGVTFYASMWDRGGGVYSPGFDLREKDDLPTIVRIVLALTRGLSAEELGQDPNVSEADVPEPRGSQYPSFHVDFNGDMWTTQGRPLFTSISYIGRGTAVWRVKNAELGERVLKSAWRADRRTSESEIYGNLGVAMAGNAWPIGVARFDSGGDVMRQDAPDQRLHISNLRSGAGDDVPDDPVLHRVLLESVGRPLWEYKTTCHLLAGLRDAIIGHRRMFERGYLHRDISAGNVLLSRNKKVEKCHGFVSDVEFAKQFSLTPLPDEPRGVQPSRRAAKKARKTISAAVAAPDGPTWVASPANSSVGEQGASMSGTTQFMAIALLQYYVGESDICPYQDATHDLESFIWVLVYAILRHEILRAEKVLDQFRSGEDSSDYEDEAEIEDEGPPPAKAGGSKDTDAGEARLAKKLEAVKAAFEANFGKCDLMDICVARRHMMAVKLAIGPHVPKGPLRDVVMSLLGGVNDANPSEMGRRPIDPLPLSYEWVLGQLDEALRAIPNSEQWLKPIV